MKFTLLVPKNNEMKCILGVGRSNAIMQNGYFSKLSMSETWRQEKRAREAFLPYAWHLKKLFFFFFKPVFYKNTPSEMGRVEPWLAMRGRNILIMAILLCTLQQS